MIKRYKKSDLTDHRIIFIDFIKNLIDIINLLNFNYKTICICKKKTPNNYY